MASFKSVPTKRKLDQLEDESQFSSKKKIKADKNTHTEDVVLFSALPPEIVHLILSFITNDTQRRHIRLVCQQWFDYINYNEFKIGLLLTSEVEQFSQCFGRYQKPIGLKFMKVDRICNIEETRNVGNKTVMRLNHLVQSISSLTQLTALDLCMKDFEVPPGLVNLQSLTVISPLHRDTILRLTNLRRLKTDSKLTEIPTTLESLNLWDTTNRQSNAAIDSTYSRLTELVISKSTGCEIPDALTNLRKLSVFDIFCKQINLMKFHNLKEFITTSEMFERELLPNQYPSSLTKLHVFSGRSVEITEDLTQLKDLHCSRANFNNLPMNFMEGCIVHDDNETLLELLDPKKVTKLKTTITPENCHVWSKFTNLIDLDISLNQTTAIVMPYLVPLPSLTQLSLCCDKYSHQWISELTNLVELRLVPELESINFDMMHQLTSLELIGSCKNIRIVNLTNLLHLRIFNETAPNAIIIHGLSTATNLTSLLVKHLQCGSSNINQSSELALLTNLRMLELGRTYGAKILNFGDLTTLQRLTFLEVRAIDKSACQSMWYLTRLTRLQQVYLPNDREVDLHAIQKGLPLCYSFP